jgi:hypothetical protein
VDDHTVVIGDPKAPLRLRVALRDLSSDVGNDRAPARYLARILIELCKCGQIDPKLDGAPAASWLLNPAISNQQVEQHIDTNLIDVPRVVPGLGGFGQTVDPTKSHIGLGRRKIEGEEIGGAVLGGPNHQLPIDHTRLITFPGGIWIDCDAQAAKPGCQLTGGLGRGSFQGLIRHFACGLCVEMAGLITDDMSFENVDITLAERVPDRRLSNSQVVGEADNKAGGAPGQGQRSPHLGGCHLIDL